MQKYLWPLRDGLVTAIPIPKWRSVRGKAKWAEGKPVPFCECTIVTGKRLTAV